jgi:hypothetical protein
MEITDSDGIRYGPIPGPGQNVKRFFEEAARTMEHTPIPWKQHPGPYAGQPPILGADGSLVIEFVTNSDDLPFIVRAVNNHAKLLAALEYTTAFLTGVIEGERIPTGIKASARVQIAAARAAIEEAKK